MMQSRRVVQSAIIFLLVSPAIVWLAGSVYLLAGTSASTGSWLSPYVAMLAFLSIVSAYVVAAGPALAVGAVFGWAQERWPMPAVVAVTLGFGLGFAAAFGGAHLLARIDATVSASPLVTGLVGGAAAFVSALVALRRLGANNSSKPTPLRGAA